MKKPHENEQKSGAAVERATGVEVQYQLDGGRVLVMYPNGISRSYAYSTFQTQFKVPYRRSKAMYVSPSDMIRQEEGTYKALRDKIKSSEKFPKEFSGLDLEALSKEFCAELDIDFIQETSLVTIERRATAFYNEFQKSRLGVNTALTGYLFLQDQYHAGSDLDLLSRLTVAQENLKNVITNIIMCHVLSVAYSTAYVKEMRKQLGYIEQLNKEGECGYIVINCTNI